MDENIFQENEIENQAENVQDDEINENNENEYSIPKMSSTDDDIMEIFKDLQTIKFTNSVGNSGENRARIIENSKTVQLETIEEYNPNKGEPLVNKEIDLGLSKIPRFSCACHKANLAVRHAISMHQIGEDLKKLNTVNAHIRKSIELNKMFSQSKARLRIENATRWSSAYMMLESVKRAYDKDLFSDDDEELKCPISLKKVEIYLQILRPAYRFSITFQNNYSSISYLIPSLKRIIFSWENMDLEPEDERFATLLIVCFKEKFKYELESEVYQVNNNKKIKEKTEF